MATAPIVTIVVFDTIVASGYTGVVERIVWRGSRLRLVGVSTRGVRMRPLPFERQLAAFLIITFLLVVSLVWSCSKPLGPNPQTTSRKVMIRLVSLPGFSSFPRWPSPHGPDHP